MWKLLQNSLDRRPPLFALLKPAVAAMLGMNAILIPLALLRPPQAGGRRDWVILSFSCIIALVGNAGIPSLRSLIHLPLSRLRVSLCRAFSHGVRGLVICLGLVPVALIEHLLPARMAFAMLGVFAVAMFAGGLRTLFGDRSLDWNEAAWVGFPTGPLLLAIFWASLSTWDAPAIVCGVASCVLIAIGGLALCHYAVARSSLAYRPEPPGLRLDRSEA